MPVHYKNITTKIKYDHYYGMPNYISSIFNLNLHTDMEVACIRTRVVLDIKKKNIWVESFKDLLYIQHKRHDDKTSCISPKENDIK